MYSSFHLYFPLKKFGLSREKSTGKIQLKIPFSFLGNQLPIVILPYFYEWFLPSPPTPSQPPPGPLQPATCNRSFNQCGFFPHAGNTPIPNTLGWLGLPLPAPIRSQHASVARTVSGHTAAAAEDQDPLVSGACRAVPRHPTSAVRGRMCPSIADSTALPAHIPPPFCQCRRHPGPLSVVRAAA